MVNASKQSNTVLTLNEAASFLRVSERTLWGRVKAGEVPHARVGNQYRFSQSQLQSWLENQATSK